MNNNKETLKFSLALIITVIILGCGICGRTDDSAVTSEDRETYDISVLADDLYSEYHENEVAADNKYKGKRIKVTGIVAEIRKDFMDDEIIDLKTDNQFMDIHCEMNKSESDKVVNLRKDSQVILIGKCKGMIIGSVQLDDCVFAN